MVVITYKKLNEDPLNTKKAFFEDKGDARVWVTQMHKLGYTCKAPPVFQERA